MNDYFLSVKVCEKVCLSSNMRTTGKKPSCGDGLWSINTYVLEAIFFTCDHNCDLIYYWFAEKPDGIKWRGISLRVKCAGAQTSCRVTSSLCAATGELPRTLLFSQTSRLSWPIYLQVCCNLFKDAFYQCLCIICIIMWCVIKDYLKVYLTQKS